VGRHSADPTFFRSPEEAHRSIARFAARWPAEDRKALLKPGVMDTLALSLAEAHRQGARGPAYDGARLGRALAFRPEDITAPVHLWHGERDTQIPVRTVRRLATKLPTCTATYYPDEAHISVITNHSANIVAALSRGPRP
jgi:pimeloyl-ACP methyl ester carboxylesterase